LGAAEGQTDQFGPPHCVILRLEWSICARFEPRPTTSWGGVVVWPTTSRSGIPAILNSSSTPRETRQVPVSSSHRWTVFTGCRVRQVGHWNPPSAHGFCRTGTRATQDRNVESFI